MKASEIYATWLRYGVSKHILDRNLLTSKLARKDYETNTTVELMAVSETSERENKKFAPPETCTSCKDDGTNSHVNWTFGHRPGLWVCTQCKSVLVCRCRHSDADGNCVYCGRKMSDEAICAYREKVAKDQAYSNSLVDPWHFTSQRDAAEARLLLDQL